MSYTRSYATWQDLPSTATPITAASLQNIEDGIVNALTVSPAVSSNFIQPSVGAATSFAIGSTISASYLLSTGLHDKRSPGDILFKVDQWGHIHGGPNDLLAPHPRQNMAQTVASFLYDQVMERIVCKSIGMNQLDDPADITGGRFGYTSGDYTGLTGLNVGVASFQIRAAAGAVPFGGDTNTPGAAAAATLCTWNFKTTEMIRYIRPNTGDGSHDYDLAGGMWIDFSVNPKGYDARHGFSQFRILDTGDVQCGRSMIYNVTPTGAALQVRNDTGQNESIIFAKSGTISGGTWRIMHYGIPPASPAFAVTALSSAALNNTATAAEVQTEYETMAPFSSPLTLTGTFLVGGGGNVVGTGTKFTTECRRGDYITTSDGSFFVILVTNDVAMNLDLAPPNAGPLTGVRRNVYCTGGPINTTPIIATFCGVARNTHYVRPNVDSSLLTGGGHVTSGYNAYGFPSGDDNPVVTIQHGGSYGVTPTGNYITLLDPTGATVWSVTGSGGMVGNVQSSACTVQSMTASRTLVNRSAEVVLADTTAAAVTATLPAAPTAGTRFVFFDAAHNWTANNFTINRNGKTIDGAAASKVMNTTDTNITLMYGTTEWHTI